MVKFNDINERFLDLGGQIIKISNIESISKTKHTGIDTLKIVTVSGDIIRKSFDNKSKLDDVYSTIISYLELMKIY